MADFKIAEKITGINEGGYANNPKDTGGETMMGIARKHWPKWEGWKYIDQYKEDYTKAKAKGITKFTLAKWINASAKVQGQPVYDMVSKFYKTNFWDTLKLDQVKDQQVANNVYDFGVNSGTSRAAKYLQRCSGVQQDGVIGPKTLAAVNGSNPEQLYENYNALRKAFYKSIAVGDQSVFLNTWLSRLKPYQK